MQNNYTVQSFFQGFKTSFAHPVLIGIFFADKVRSLIGIVMDSFSAIMEQASIEDPKDMNAVVVSEMTISEETVKLVRCSSSYPLPFPSLRL